ncbi:MAG TPA: metal-dependent hydrolase [Acidobacteriota bacterium]|nr:metal-dependent hydrolase [Acidobacteriota bacterium]
MKTSLLRIAGLVLLGTISGLARPADTTTLTWHGHAAFDIVTPKGKVLMIDPWLKNPMNPDAKNGKDPVAAVAKADYILITHGHFDHVGDSVAIAKKTGARLVTNFELGSNMAKLLGYPKDQMGFDTLMNIGGEITIADGEVTVDMVPAIHSSGMGNPLAGDKDPDAVYGGNPAGFVIRIKNGPTIYDTGDTAYFTDMKLIGEYAPDVALVNIGGHFGMEPPMAARAAQAVRAKLAIPMHYATFPVLTQNADGFVKLLNQMHIRSKVMQPGESLTFTGKKMMAGK